jgi:predicted DNA-binding protein
MSYLTIPTGGTMKKLHYGKSLTIALPKEVYDLIKQKSDEMEESMGTIVREMLESSINELKGKTNG